MQYLLLAEMGYEQAQYNAAYLLESQNVSSPLTLALWTRSAKQVLQLALFNFAPIFCRSLLCVLL